MLRRNKNTIQFIMTSLCIVFIHISVFSQLHINFKGGVNYSKYSTEEDVDLKSLSKSGFHAGLDFRLGKGAFYFQPGAFYYKSGFLLEPTSLPGAFDNDVNINSLKIPLGLGYDLVHENNFRFRVYGSAVANLILNVDENDLGVTKEMYNNLNMGANVGAGIDLFILTIEANYEIGVSDLFNNGDNGIISFGTGAKNNVFSVSAGIRI